MSTTRIQDGGDKLDAVSYHPVPRTPHRERLQGFVLRCGWVALARTPVFVLSAVVLGKRKVFVLCCA